MQAPLLYLLWVRLKICSIDNILNTQRLPSLFDFDIWIKERMNYQHRNVKTNYLVPSFKEYPTYHELSLMSRVKVALFRRCLFVGVLCPSGKLVHGTGGLVSWWCSTVNQPWAPNVVSRCPSWYGLRCCQDVELHPITTTKTYVNKINLFIYNCQNPHVQHFHATWRDDRVHHLPFWEFEGFGPLGLKPWPNQSNHLKIYTCRFLARRLALFR